MLALKARVGENDELRQAVKSQLVDTAVTLRVVAVDSFPAALPARLSLARSEALKTGAVAVFWYERPGPGENYLFVMDPAGGRLLVRTVEPSASGGGAEEVAIIVRESVRALLQGGRIGVKAPVLVPRPAPRTGLRAAVRAASTGPRPRPGPALFGETRPARRWMSVELSYAFETYATKHPVLNGLWAALALHMTRNWSSFVGYRYCQPMKISGDITFSRLQRHILATGVRFRWPVHRFEIGGSAEMVLEYVENDTDEVEGVSASPDREDFVVAGAALFQVAFRVVPWLRIIAHAGVEVPVNPKRYVRTGPLPGEREVLLSPWPVRPRAGLGVAADLF